MESSQRLNKLNSPLWACFKIDKETSGIMFPSKIIYSHALKGTRTNYFGGNIPHRSLSITKHQLQWIETSLKSFFNKEILDVQTWKTRTFAKVFSGAEVMFRILFQYFSWGVVRIYLNKSIVWYVFSVYIATEVPYMRIKCCSITEQDNIPAGVIPPAWKLYMLQFQLPPPDVAPMW